MRRYSSEYRAIQPFVVEDIRRILTAGGAAATSSGGGGGIAAHALSDTSIHTGQLAASQALWAVTDTEFTTHTGDPDAHHARSHVLATNAGLGPDHTVSGAMAGWVLRATASNAARMAQLMVGDLGASGDAWDVVSLTAANTVGLRTPSSDVRSGAAEAYLKSNAAGEIGLKGLAIGGAMIFGGSGNIGTEPDIQFTGNAFLAAEGSLYVSLDSDNNLSSGNALIVGHNSSTTTGFAELFRFTDTGRLGIGTDAPSYELDVLGEARASVALRSAAAYLSTRVRTPLVDTASGHLSLAPAVDLLLEPGSSLVKLQAGVALQSHNYASQTTGVRITGAGEGDFRYLYTDEMHAKAFIADLEQALAGGQIITKSVTLLASDFTAPAAGGIASLHVKDLPSAPGMQVFQVGDIIRLRQFSRSGGALNITNCWGVVTNPVDLLNGSQLWTFTRSAAPNAGAMAAGTVIQADAIVLDYGTSGNGFYEVNAIDGLNAANSPYLQFVRWTGHPNSGQVVRLRAGQLRGLFAQDEFGMFVGTGTGDTDRWLRLSDYAAGNGINNLPIRMFNAGVNTGIWNPDGTMYLGFDGIATQAERDFSVATDFVRIGRSSGNNPNLYWSKTGGALALRSGTASKIILESDGDSYFAGVMTIGTGGEIRQGTGALGTDYTGLRVWRESGIGRIGGYNNNVVQWSANTLGKMEAGGGKVWLDANGINLQPSIDIFDIATSASWVGTNSTFVVYHQDFSSYLNFIPAGVIDMSSAVNNVEILAKARATGASKTASLTIATETGSYGQSKITLNNSLNTKRIQITSNLIDLVGPVVASATVTANQLVSNTGFVTSQNAIQFWMTDGTAFQQTRMGSLMVSSNGADYVNVPPWGIYSAGAVAIGAALTSGYMLDVAGAAIIRNNSRIAGAWYFGQIATPGAFAGHLPVWWDGTNLRARLPNGTLKTFTWT